MPTTSLANKAPNLEVLKEIGDLSSEGVIVYSSTDQKIIYSNAIASNLIGLQENSSLTDVQRLMARIVEEDQRYMALVYSSVISESVTPEFELRLERDNSQTFICCKGYRLADNSTIIVFLQDITKPKDHENYLVEFGARKNTVLDIVSHHINSALTLMQNLSKEAQKYVGSDADKNLKIYLGLLHDNSKTCLEIITGLLKHEHEKSPAIGTTNDRIDVVNKISIVHDELTQSYRTREFIFQHSNRPTYAWADDVKLLQVVNNLVTNAVKFSPVTEPITIRILDGNDDVVISVEDRGIGIPDSLKPLIFERQPGTGRTGLNGEKSLGLGLSICKHLVELMSGEIWFESKEGEGSTFFFRLPKAS